MKTTGRLLEKLISLDLVMLGVRGEPSYALLHNLRECLESFSNSHPFASSVLSLPSVSSSVFPNSRLGFLGDVFIHISKRGLFTSCDDPTLQLSSEQ